MAIKINTEKRIFTLETKHTMYQMQADTYGVLRHLWYGAKTGCDMSYLQDYPDVGFSGNPHDAGNDRTYSLDTLPLEYAGAGIGDFRVPAVEAVHADGKGRALSRPMDAHADFASGFHRQFAVVLAGCALRHEFGTMPYAGAFRFPIPPRRVPARRIAFSTRLLRLRDTSTFCRSRTHGHLFFH